MTNVRSLNNKLGDLQYFLDSNNPDIVILTETWLDSHMPSSLIACSKSFNVFRKDRLSRGGGICMLVRKFSNINVTPVNLPADLDDLDILAVDLQDCNGTLPLRLVVTYRPPGYSSIDNIRLFSALHSLADGCVRLCVFGDFNLPRFNWDLFVYPDNYLYCTAADFICNHGLSQLVNDPTRGNNILDLILCSDPLCCDDVSVIPPLSNSDHSIVSFSLYISLPQSSSSVQVNNVARPNFSKVDWPGLCNYLSTVDSLSEFMCCKSVHEYWEAFLEIISIGIEQFVPNYTNTKHVASTKWYPRHIRTLFCQKEKVLADVQTFQNHSLT